MHTTEKNCRFCQNHLKVTFVNLGMYPLSNSYLSAEEVDRMCPFYPLHAYVCEKCFLVQLEEFESPENIFTQYSYASSYSQSWLAHMKKYSQMIVKRLGLGPKSLVMELASNDGYLLQYFKEQGIPTLGIEPAENVAKTAIEKGIKTVTEFFGTQLADKLRKKENIKADLLVGNNVLAHVPNINDFVAGMKTILAEDGVITMEFPHLLQLIQHNQFDTIYQEHYSYLSLMTTEKIFAQHGLTLFDVEELPTHGGSLRIYAKHAENKTHEVQKSVSHLKEKEIKFGLGDLKIYLEFGERVKAHKRKLLSLLIEQKNLGKKIVGYGAPAKGNTLLTYCGIRSDFIDYVVDRSPLKQGKYLPGTLVPILNPKQIDETKPDFILILPWNLKDEIMEQMAHTRKWGCRFIVPIPEVSVI